MYQMELHSFKYTDQYIDRCMSHFLAFC